MQPWPENKASLLRFGLAAGRVLGDILYPPHCACCQAPVEAAHALCRSCFGAVRFIAPPQCVSCGLPFSYEAEQGLHCAPCLDDPPPYAIARAALVYDEASRPLVTRFKYGDRVPLAPLLARWMAQAGRPLCPGVDYIVPVPLHWRRLLTRRYNQALVLARLLASPLGVTLLADGLVRRRFTQPQVGLSRSERQRNVKHAFAVPAGRRERLAGATVLLVDDVLTSGATLESCTRTLLQAGVREVRVLTLARRVELD